ncbi:unnamed protein product [Colias eurytheme]|nr:unnamed protein product [Colias eurytheme]
MPSELFFKRQNRDKIPMFRDINETEDDSEVSDRDKLQEEKEEQKLRKLVKKRRDRAEAKEKCHAFEENGRTLETGTE